MTGAGRGIGHATALALARAGLDVAVNDLDASSAETAAQTVRELGRRSLSLAGDVSSPVEVRSLVQHLTESWGGVDVPINKGIAERPIYHEFAHSSHETEGDRTDRHPSSAFASGRRIASPRGWSLQDWSHGLGSSRVELTPGRCGQRLDLQRLFSLARKDGGEFCAEIFLGMRWPNMASPD